MDLTGEERGQSIQIGAVILFGALIILLATYQAFVVPDQNRGVEFKHSQTVQNDLKELRSDVISVASSGGESSATVQLGTEYPSRAVFLNPGPPSGSLRTVGTSNASINISVANATATGGATEAGDFWNGTTRSYSTGALVYQPNYKEYTNAPTTVYSNSVLYNRFEDGNLTLTDQSLVAGRSINLIALNGSISTGQSGSASVGVRATSASATRVPVTNRSAGENVTLRLPTRLSQGTWDSLLQAERVTSGGHVRNVTVVEQPGRFDELVVEMEPDVTYNLKLSRVGVGSKVDTTTPGSYLVKTGGQNVVVPEGQNVTLEVQVRDTYNNPSSGELVYARTSRSDSNITELAESDSEGTVELTYSPPDDINGGAKTAYVNVSLDGAGLTSSQFDSSTAENVSFTLSVDNTDGSGTTSDSSPAYTIGFEPSRMASNDPGLTCTSSNCTYDTFDDTNNQFRLISLTSPQAVGASVDFALNTTDFGTLVNEDTETNNQGEANASFDATGDGTISAFVSTGTDSDDLPVRIINTSTTPSGQGTIVFRRNNDLKSITTGGTVTTYTTTQPKAIGPKTADLGTGDSRTDIPFKGNNNGHLKAVTDADSVTTLDNSEVNDYPIGVGDWDNDGTVEVVYAKNSEIYEYDGSTDRLEYSVSTGSYDCNNGQSPCTVDTQAIAGVGDITGDGNDEIVYVDNDNGDLVYFDGNNEFEITNSLDNTKAVSTPGDFDDDGSDEVAVKTGNQEFTLYDSSGSDGIKTTGYQIRAAPMGAHDWNGDGRTDVIHLDGNDELRFFDWVPGTPGTVTDTNGNDVKASSSQGAR